MEFPVLVPQKKIALIAPAGCVEREQLEPGIQLLQEKGFKLKHSAKLFGKYRYFSGTIEERLQEIHENLIDPEVGALYAVRGGMGSSQLLSSLNYRLWINRKKLLIGFSDLTSLQWALWTKFKMPSLTGMNLTSQLRKSNPHHELFFKLLTGNKKAIELKDLHSDDILIAQEGRASGLIIGGTLSIINSILGTAFFPRLPSIILFLEDVQEPLYRIERSLIQLKMAGVLEKIKGLILGQFILDNEAVQLYPVLDYLFPDNIPVILNFPYGHIKNCSPLPLGIHAELSTTPIRISW